ncbi:helix-turn-helix transcriptional regulator [Curtobacterium sp. AB7]|uniref:helix-turn-helix transcriptional regulator n=1 Tax=Curtobacterium sp. AB7 TaxID=3349327 RepID=UPI0038370183
MAGDPLLPVHTDARGLNIEEAVGFYERVYASHDISIGQAEPDGFRWRYRAIGDDDVTVATSAVAARRWGTINPGRQYILAWATGAGITLDTGSRDPILMQPGAPVMYPAGREFTFDALPTTQHLIRFDGSFLEAVAAATYRTIPGPLTFTSEVAPHAQQQLQEVIRGAAGELLNPATDRQHRSLLNTTLAEALVNAFHAAPNIDVTLADGPTTMRHAQEWMVANAQQPISISDVAAATGVAVRSLQSSFQKHAGMSPLTFLRQVRLHRVRAELRAADPTATSVADVAIRWGFRHLGRFAGSYASTFGELPSTTLRTLHGRHE